MADWIKLAEKMQFRAEVAGALGNGPLERSYCRRRDYAALRATAEGMKPWGAICEVPDAPVDLMLARSRR